MPISQEELAREQSGEADKPFDDGSDAAADEALDEAIDAEKAKQPQG